MSSEILSHRRGRGRAPILLTQRGLPIWDASAVDWVVGPGSGGCIVIIKIVDGHHIDLPPRPVEGAEKEAGSHRHAGSPYISDMRTSDVAGPGPPVYRWIGRPPPRTIDDRRIIVGDIHHLWIRRCN